MTTQPEHPSAPARHENPEQTDQAAPTGGGSGAAPCSDSLAYPCGAKPYPHPTDICWWCGENLEPVPVLCETHGESGVEWGVSFQGSNPEEDKFVRCANRVEAEKLMQIIEKLGEPAPIASDEPRRLGDVPSNELSGVECIHRRLNTHNLFGKEAQRVAGGVAIVIPEVESGALVLGTAAGSEIHRRTHANETASVLLGVESESNFGSGMDGSDKRIFHSDGGLQCSQANVKNQNNQAQPPSESE